jgi:Legume lectin domain/Chitobiase/beta-hexosaminidase C-terminal domain
MTDSRRKSARVRKMQSESTFLSRVCHRLSATLCLIASVTVATHGQTPVLTQHNDIGRTGQNTAETILTPSNVNSTQFGKLFSIKVDGQVYAQPLYVPGMTINGAVHNVLIVATEADSVYAFDADSNTGANATYLWHASVIDTAHGAASGATPVPYTTVNCTDMQPQSGISSAPVIDTTTGTIYVEGESIEGGNVVHRLHALDINTGNEKSFGPVVIDALPNGVPGTGDGSSGGVLQFDNLTQHNRPGLLLFNGTIFVGFASHCDNGAYHGWLFAYSESSLARLAYFNTTPYGGLGGFWSSGAGLAADSSGNMFLVTGNGSYDTNNPAIDYGDSILKMTYASGAFTVADYFTPYNQSSLSGGDIDLGSGGVLLLPTQPGTYPNELVEMGKQGTMYLVSRDTMTTTPAHYCNGCSSDPEIVQESSGGQFAGMWSMPAYWNNTVYFAGSGGPLTAIPLSGGKLNYSSVTTSSPTFGFPGATPSISASGSTNGIVWLIDSSQYGSPGPGPGPAVLHAFNATSVSTELYNSTQAASGRDTAGNAVKFSVPTITNGKVYEGAAQEVDVYGLLSETAPVTNAPVISPASESVTTSVQVTITDSTSGSSIYYTTDGTTPVPGSGSTVKYSGAFTLTSSATVNAIATAGSHTNSAVTSEIYSIQSNPITSVNDSSGFSASGLALSGNATLNGTRLRLTDGGGNEAGSGFVTTPMNIQSFTADFSFQLTNPNADGITFTIHGGSTAAALGPNGGGLGYGPVTVGGTGGIPSSIAIKYDLYNNNGEGTDSTGDYSDGASPTTPFVDMTSSGVNLHSGDIFQVHLSYSGTNLAMTITDETTEGEFANTFANVNIPSTIGGNAGYVGFTGGTGGATAIQEIIGFSFVSGPASLPQAATPVISPAAGSYPGSVAVSISDLTTGNSIYYTTNGNPPTMSSTKYTGTFTLTSSATVEAIAIASGYTNSAVAGTAYTVTTNTAPDINFSAGFTGETSLTLNGGAIISGSRLRLTDGGSNEARSAFFTIPVNVAQFTSDFSFQLTNPNADGFTFAIQGSGATAVGPSGGGLGYGPDNVTNPSSSPNTPIAKSVAIKFDLYNNAGEGADSTGSYTNGASPTTPATDMTSSGVNLHSGDVFKVHVTYNGSTLTWTVTDTTTATTFTTSATVNIPSLIGGSTAFAGFTGGTGGATATQEIISWTLTSGSPSPTQYEPESTAVFNASKSSGPTYRVFAWSGFTDGEGTTLDGTAPGQSVTMTLNIPQAGTYDVQYATKAYPTRGIVQLSVNSSNVGPAEDQYSSTAVERVFDLGNITIAAGNQPFVFTTTGKNSASSGYTQAYDYIKLTPQ